MKKQVTRIKTEFTQLKSVRIAHDILKAIPKGVSFSDFVHDALTEKLARIRKTKVRK